MREAKLQNELLSRGASALALVLLNHIIETLSLPIKGADLQKTRPLYFKGSSDLKKAYDELIATGLIKADYKAGNIDNIQIDAIMYREFTDVSGGITVTKVKPQPKKKPIDDIPDEVKDIVLHYNSYALLPRPSTMTPLVISRITEKLKILSPEQLKEAITYASNQQWLVNKAAEPWCNLGWVLGAIDGFCVGGKYRGNKADDAVNKYKTIDNESTEVFW